MTPLDRETLRNVIEALLFVKTIIIFIFGLLNKEAPNAAL